MLVDDAMNKCVGARGEVFMTRECKIPHGCYLSYPQVNGKKARDH